MKKMLLRLGMFPFIASAAPIIILYIWFRLTPFSIEDLPPLKNGDLVFQTTIAPQSVAIIFASGSAYTHVGMIKINSDSVPMVVEAAGTVREIPLEKWVKQGVGSRITISRIKNLKETDARKALDTSLSYYGKPYDFYFFPDNDAIYCSELVYKSFAGGSGIIVGKEQSVEELDVDNFAVRGLIEKRWRTYPACKGGVDFESCYQLIMKQKLVTPASMAEDDKVEIIYSDYGILK